MDYEGKVDNLVSVVLPTRNRSTYLKDSLQSVINQTYEDLEVVVVDDASTDDTKQLLESFQAKDCRIRYICNENPGGASAARNTGIKHARGTFIAFQDDDDIWHPEKIQRQLSAFKQHW